MELSRQIPILNQAGQKKLEAATVAIIGVGALGSAAAEILTRAGIRNLILIDRDIIEESNLQRQTFYTQKDCGSWKAEIAAKNCKAINPKIKIKVIKEHLDHTNINQIKADLILDGTDNFFTRFLINDYAQKNKTPWIFASVLGTKGQVAEISPEGPCFHCIFQEPTATLGTCTTEGVLAPLPKIIAGIQTTKAIKYLTTGKIKSSFAHYDSWENTLQELSVAKNPNCPTCNKDYTYLSGKNVENIIALCNNLFQMKLTKEISSTQLKKIGLQKQKSGIWIGKGITVFPNKRITIQASSQEQAKAKRDKLFE